MEQKKALAVFIKSFRYFICMVLLLGIAVFACSAVFRDAKVLNTVEVAVVIPKEKGEELRLLTGLASAMQSTKSICRMRYVDEPEAMEQLANGQVQAVLIFPEHFYIGCQFADVSGIVAGWCLDSVDGRSRCVCGVGTGAVWQHKDCLSGYRAESRNELSEDCIDPHGTV